MKKIVITVIFMLLALPTMSQSDEVQPDAVQIIEGGVTFDWISKSQMQRDENISQIQKILFNEKTVLKYPKKEFKAKYAPFLKDKDNIKNYIEIKNGKREDDEKIYCAFFWKKDFLYAYGIQYKNNMKNIYYYDAMGGLRWIDTFSDNYPKFPYQATQYSIKGDLVATYYYISDTDQYVYGPNKEFKGRWYNDKLYNRKAKVIMTRSNY